MILLFEKDGLRNRIIINVHIQRIYIQTHTYTHIHIRTCIPVHKSLYMYYFKNDLICTRQIKFIDIEILLILIIIHYILSLFVSQSNCIKRNLSMFNMYVYKLLIKLYNFKEIPFHVQSQQI